MSEVFVTRPNTATKCALVTAVQAAHGEKLNGCGVESGRNVVVKCMQTSSIKHLIYLKKKLCYRLNKKLYLQVIKISVHGCPNETYRPRVISVVARK
jgi:hypothetical protein